MSILPLPPLGGAKWQSGFLGKEKQLLRARSSPWSDGIVPFRRGEGVALCGKWGRTTRFGELKVYLCGFGGKGIGDLMRFEIRNNQCVHRPDSILYSAHLWQAKKLADEFGNTTLQCMTTGPAPLQAAVSKKTFFLDGPGYESGCWRCQIIFCSKWMPKKRSNFAIT